MIRPNLLLEPTRTGRTIIMMKKNVGTIDRAMRIIAGLVLLAMFFVYPDASWRYWTLIGIIPLATGLLSSCPLYTLLGISTCPMQKA